MTTDSHSESMTVHHKEFAAMHREMKHWFDRQERNGWPSDDVRLWAHHVMWSLWSLSQVKGEPPPVLLHGLAEYAGNLLRAKREAAHRKEFEFEPYNEIFGPHRNGG